MSAIVTKIQVVLCMEDEVWSLTSYQCSECVCNKVGGEGNKQAV